jgi:Protein of unknown function (DUF1579)
MSAEHEIFQKDVGTWDAEVVVRPGPGAPPQTSRGVAVNRLIGGVWLVSDFKNDSDFEGHGVYGWDPAKKKYVGTWVDSMRTFLAPMEGMWDAATKTMTFVGEGTTADGRTMRWRETTTVTGPDTQVFRTFIAGAGENGADLEVVTTTYTRRK